MKNYERLAGLPYPLGAIYDGHGTNFAVCSAGASAVELCLFDKAYGEVEYVRIPLSERNDVWHVYLSGVGPGQLYGYRVHGEYNPEKGLRFNPAKVLLDPYARAVTPSFNWHDSLYGYKLSSRKADLSLDHRDSAAFAPKAIVVDHYFDWGSEEVPLVPESETIIYELHVKGFSITNPEVPEKLRGTYAGLAHPTSIEYLKKLGVTTVELMPVHQFVNDQHLQEKGLSNYWGYNTIGFFAPHEAYSSDRTPGGQVNEFKSMVATLHQAGIEVILDVVFNHTAEGNELGPTLCFRGLDNQNYYRLEKDARYYTDFTGTGNTLNTTSRPALQMVMDSLRYWVQEMRIDGFRFDLAATLARQQRGIDHSAAFFQVIHQDPVLSQVKLIAEPWDIGRNGYQLGRFSKPWCEWNGKFRDEVRTFWNRSRSQTKDFVNRFIGSPDIYLTKGRMAVASINFVTAHDGFTLADLVAYNHKHNEGNGEDNKDGEAHNHSHNCGVEGPTFDPKVVALRRRQQRNHLMTLLLAQGIPMICAGDEAGRTQLGNNNAYCQDNEISYINWKEPDVDLFEFTALLITIRRQYPIFRSESWLNHKNRDWQCFTPFGAKFELRAGSKRNAFGLLLTSETVFYICFNGGRTATEFKLPQGDWEMLVSSDAGLMNKVSPLDELNLAAKSMVLLKRK